MAEETLTIATRRSPLALWQAHTVKAQLEQLHPHLQVELLPIVTKGDKILDTPLAKVGGKGLFVKELEVAMLEGRADIAVHSMKDVPVEFPEGLGLHIICEQGDPRDAFVSNSYKQIDELPPGAIVGTSSMRRQCQLRARRPDLQVTDLRGNVNTRLQKLDDGQYDAIILAAAGLQRLDMAYRIASYLTPEESLPAVGQGALGIECRSNDSRVKSLLAPLDHPETRTRVLAARAFNETLEGGCQVPIGGFALLEAGQVYLRGLVGQPDGSQLITGEIRGDADDAVQLGQTLAKQLLAQGADVILKQVYG